MRPGSFYAPSDSGSKSITEMLHDLSPLHAIREAERALLRIPDGIDRTGNEVANDDRT